MDLMPVFKYKYSLNQHLVTHDPNAKMKCEVCGKVLKTLCTLAVHMRKIHTNRERLNCDICHQAFYNLRRHVETIHSTAERPRFPCSFPGCDKTYQNQRSVLQHVRVEHAENPIRFPCALCTKEFKYRAHLEDHISTHTTEKPFNCATCGKSFALRQQLERHEATHLEKSEREISNCNFCPHTFFSRTNLGEHIRAVHENQRNYSCTFCGNRFSTSSHLKCHVEAVHPASKEKIHSCDKCEYRSHSKRNFAKHRRRHDVKKHECYFCGKKFIGFSELVRHFGHIHTLEKKNKL